MRCSYEWAYDKRSCLANCVERPELDPHREGLELLTIRLSACQRSVRVVVVGLSADNMRDEGERKRRVLKGERRFEFVDSNDGDEGRLRRRSRGLTIFLRMWFPVTANLRPIPCGSRTQDTDPQRFTTTR